MTCIHCGGEKLTMSYTLRCTPESREPRNLELRLCTACLRTLCAEPDIELATDRQFPTAN